MRRMITALVLAATMVLATASVALAAPNENAFCAGPNTATHGGHIRGYVGAPTLDGPGVRGRAAHFGDKDTSPGASFCQGDNSAPSLGDDHKPVLG